MHRNEILSTYTFFTLFLHIGEVERCAPFVYAIVQAKTYTQLHVVLLLCGCVLWVMSVCVLRRKEHDFWYTELMAYFAWYPSETQKCNVTQ